MRRKLAVLAGAVLLLALLAPFAGADWNDDIIFMAANYQLQTLSDQTMPFRPKGSGTIYVPYTLFDSATNGGANLGISWGQNTALGTFTMFNKDGKFLTFDLNSGLVYDYAPPDGALLPQIPRAILRNGVVYLPAASVCSYFGLQSFQSTVTIGDHAYLIIRVKNENAGLSDSEFLNSAVSSMLTALNLYYRDHSGQGETPVQPPVQSPSPTPVEENRDGLRTYLSFRMETGEAGASILDTLKSHGRTALLFFTPEQLRAGDDLVRRAAAEGHSLGLLVPGDSAEAALAALEEGNRLLERVALTRTRMVLVDGGGSAVVQALTEARWLCWSPNLDGVPGGRSAERTASTVLQALETKESVARIVMDDGHASAGALGRVLRAIREDGYSYRLAVETDF